MHQSRTQADSPERSGTNFVPAALEILLGEIRGHLLEDLVSIVLASGLQDSVAGAHVVHQEIAVRVKGNGAERGGNRKRSTINFCSRGRTRQCFDVARCTADFVEQAEALLCSRAASELRISRGRLGSANKAS